MTTSKFNNVKAHNAEVLNTIRAAAPKAKRTKVNAAAHEAAGNVDAQRIYAERIAQANDDLLASYNVPSKMRIAVAAITRLLAFSVSMYWGLEAASLLMVAAVSLTASAFITWVVAFMAMVLAFYAAWQTAAAIGQFVLDFKVENIRDTGRDLRIAAAKRVSLVKGWFRKPEVELELEPQGVAA